ncbi:wee1-like protein kinase [Corticium candelabrum]|uniref:wee1-like protein kinase n=1 Tax=Corticium candelabrum TaxID=121492 RepID=UPI002E258066|nr:wee1-like protein kinase [Corticium candelabrum]
MSLDGLRKRFPQRPIAVRLNFEEESSPRPNRNPADNLHLKSESISMTISEFDDSPMDSSFSWDPRLATPERASSPCLSCSPLSLSPLTSPPRKIEKRLGALRLFEDPRTPRSLIQQHERRKSRLVGGKLSRTAPGAVRGQRKMSIGANVNPFTHAVQNSVPKRGKRNIDETLFDINDGSPFGEKNLTLRESNISRYTPEFQEIDKIGSGEFGTVCKCRNRLDGCIYALKRSKKPVAGCAAQQAALREVAAHAILGAHPHIVRYFSAWAEQDHMIIQNEFCNGGSLSSVIAEKTFAGTKFTECDLKRVLLQVAHGLKYIHSMNLAHLDIKPGNIFICHPDQEDASAHPVYDSDCCSREAVNQIIYKIGDMGHVTSIYHPQVEEGDCRYMARELLQEDYSDLQKADILSLGLTVFVMGGGGELPKNGPEWHRIRDGCLPDLIHCSSPFNQLLKAMVHPESTARPSAAVLTQHPVLYPLATKSKDELRRELNAEKFKNELLVRELEQARQRKDPKSSCCSRLVGGKSQRVVNRSLSVSGW